MHTMKIEVTKNLWLEVPTVCKALTGKILVFLISGCLMGGGHSRKLECRSKSTMWPLEPEKQACVSWEVAITVNNNKCYLYVSLEVECYCKVEQL